MGKFGSARAALVDC